MGFIKEKLATGYGFIGRDDVDKVVEENRLYPCLVRCGSGRFSCPAQDVKHFVEIIEADGRDYIRDISLLNRHSL